MLFTFTAWVDSHKTHYDGREHRSLCRSCVISDFRREVDRVAFFWVVTLEDGTDRFLETSVRDYSYSRNNPE